MRAHVNRILAGTVLAALSLAACRAGASLEMDLENTWRNAMLSNAPTGAQGSVAWVSLAFSSNSVVTWKWVRDGKQESHYGSFSISSRSVPGGRSAINDIVIVPATIAADRPITLHGATIRGDNRFPALWVVMKWFDDSGNQVTCVRESEFAEWQEFLDLLNKAEAAAKPASSAPAQPPDGRGADAAPVPPAGGARGESSTSGK